MYREKARWEIHKKAKCHFEQTLEAILQETAAVRPLTFHLKNYPSETNKIRRTQLEKQGQTHVMFFYRPLLMDVPVLADQ